MSRRRGRLPDDQVRRYGLNNKSNNKTRQTARDSKREQETTTAVPLSAGGTAPFSKALGPWICARSGDISSPPHTAKTIADGLVSAYAPLMLLTSSQPTLRYPIVMGPGNARCLYSLPAIGASSDCSSLPLLDRTVQTYSTELFQPLGSQEVPSEHPPLSSGDVILLCNLEDPTPSRCFAACWS